jgi:hypothetical protein
MVRRLIGLELSSVPFVRDYVQSGFDGPILNAVTMPTIRVGKRHFRAGEAGYRDALCDRIGSIVMNVPMQEGEALRISFNDKSEISISRRAEDYTGPETFTFRDNQGLWAG